MDATRQQEEFETIRCARLSPLERKLVCASFGIGVVLLVIVMVGMIDRLI